MRTKYKICGLYRKTDIEYINQIKPDYCGFIIDYLKSSEFGTGGSGKIIEICG